MTATPLDSALTHGPAQHRPTPLDAFTLAVGWFNAGHRIEIQGLAAELGVSRITLHRWVGTRDALLSEILWHLTDHAIDREVERLSRRPAAGGRVPAIMGRLATRVVHNRGVQRMQSDELGLLTTLTTSDASTYQRRLIARVVALLDEDRHHGQLVAGIPTPDLAFATVRLTEAFVHTPAITGNPAAPERVQPILDALLAPHPSRPLTRRSRARSDRSSHEAPPPLHVDPA
jgi:AcrR family transcriptional regulator